MKFGHEVFVRLYYSRYPKKPKALYHPTPGKISPLITFYICIYIFYLSYIYLDRKSSLVKLAESERVKDRSDEKNRGTDKECAESDRRDERLLGKDQKLGRYFQEVALDGHLILSLLVWMAHVSRVLPSYKNVVRPSSAVLRGHRHPAFTLQV